jgi:hypothetical protein
MPVAVYVIDSPDDPNCLARDSRFDRTVAVRFFARPITRNRLILSVQKETTVTRKRLHLVDRRNGLNSLD